MCAVSEEYAEESWRELPVLSQLPFVAGLPNAVPDERPMTKGEDLIIAKAEAKRTIQIQYGLTVDPDARIFVFVGR